MLFENGNDYSEGIKDKFVETAEENGMEVVDADNNPIKEVAIIELKDGQEVFKEMY